MQDSSPSSICTSLCPPADPRKSLHMHHCRQQCSVTCSVWECRLEGRGASLFLVVRAVLCESAEEHVHRAVRGL